MLPFGRLWYDTLDHAIGYAMHRSRSHDAVIRLYDKAGNVIETNRPCDPKSFIISRNNVYFEVTLMQHCSRQAHMLQICSFFQVANNLFRLRGTPNAKAQ